MARNNSSCLADIFVQRSRLSNAFDRRWDALDPHPAAWRLPLDRLFCHDRPVMERVYALAEQALRAGQQENPVHVFPFRMTTANLEQHSNSPWRAFWNNLKVGYDAFEATRTLPVVYVCRGAYLIEGDDPTREANPPADCAVQIPLMAEAKSNQGIARASLRPATTTRSARVPTAFVRPRVAATTYPRDNVAECNRLWKPATGTTRRDWLTICKQPTFSKGPPCIWFAGPPEYHCSTLKCSWPRKIMDAVMARR